MIILKPWNPEMIKSQLLFIFIESVFTLRLVYISSCTFSIEDWIDLIQINIDLPARRWDGEFWIISPAEFVSKALEMKSRKVYHYISRGIFMKINRQCRLSLLKLSKYIFAKKQNYKTDHKDINRLLNQGVEDAF